MLARTRRPRSPLPPTRRLVPLAVAGALIALPVLSGCTDNTRASSDDGPTGDPRALTVAASDTACAVSGSGAPSGKLTFTVTNSGSKINEFYLLAADGLRIVGEVENIGPGITRDLVLTAPAGAYFTACKPGMVGDGIRSGFAVAESGQDTAIGDDGELVAAANANYASYVRDQTDQLLAKTEEFVAAYKAGDDAKARALYPVARVHWERVEPVAESFGDLDPKTDLREADLEPGQRWTGWHRIEKDLWPARAKGYTALSTSARATYADDLLKNTRTLDERTRTLSFSVDQIANGARGLLDEVASSKVTGEEEYWSRTDLYDFQANVDGARVAYEGLRPILQQRDAALDTQLDSRFSALQSLLDEQRSGAGFTLYDDVSKTDVKALSDAVNALAEPLSQLTAAVS